MVYCNQSNQTSYPFTLPNLPYDKKAFEPYFTSKTFDYHYDQHHKTYVENLNKLLLEENYKELQKKTLEEIIIYSSNLVTDNPCNKSPIFNNAAQIWNHSFFWYSIKPHGGGNPTGKILEQINKDFGNVKNFTEELKDKSTKKFGSGWVWLVFHNNKLNIMTTNDADTPITKSIQPILTCDVWEHSYYIDYYNKRPDYITAYINNMINWDFANMKLTTLINNI